MKKNPKSITFQHAAAELCVSESTVLRLVQRGTLRATKPVLHNGHWTRRIIPDKSFLDELTRRVHGLKATRRKHIPDTRTVQLRNEDSNTFQTVTPAEEALEKCRNAMNICLEAQKACEKDMQECRSRAAECKGESAHVDEVADACRLHKDSALKSAAHVDEMNNVIRNWRDREAYHHQKCENSVMKCQDINDSITRYQHEVDTWAMEKLRTIKASELTCTRCTAILATACVLQLILAVYYTLCHHNII